ncbi:MAG TPA: PAS domain S-box protein [Steroidobacteraceae bacterium]|nr:PAS domain S-box protein [Steroidobacteraceae bacterium]
MSNERILIVEDEALIAEEIRERLSAANYTIVGTCDSGTTAIEQAGLVQPDLVLMDVRLKGQIDGIEAAEIIYDRYSVPVVYLTAHSDQATLQRAKARAAFGYVLKPFTVENLLVAIDLGLHRARIEARLREHELTHATIVSSISDAVIATDRSGRVRFMNAAAEQLTGWSTRDAESRALGAVVRLVDQHGRPTHERLAKRIITGRTPLHFSRDDHLLRATGERVPIEGGAAPVIDYLGRAVGLTVTVADASAARRAERELRARSEELRTVVDTAVDGVMMLDAEGHIRMFNPACERLFGYAAEEVLGHNALELMPSPFASAGGRASAFPAAGARPPLFAHGRVASGVRKDGTTLPLEVSLGETRQDGKPVYVVVVHDISERRELEAAYFDAIGYEQRRVAQDLHDGLGQELTGLALLLSALERAASESGLSNASDLARLRDLATHTIGTCRSVARGLLPVEDSPEGLASGLRDLVRRLNEVPGAAIQFSMIEAASVGLSSSTADHLYRIAQEALTNALKHAHANSINVTLEVAPARIVLSVCDDGTGIAALRPDSGLGLKTMRYRAELIGARLSIEPQGPAGTCVICDCPQPA